MIRFHPAAPVCFDHAITSITNLSIHEIEAGVLRGAYVLVNEDKILDCRSPAMVINLKTSEVLASVKTTSATPDVNANGGRLEIYEFV